MAPPPCGRSPRGPPEPRRAPRRAAQAADRLPRRLPRRASASASGRTTRARHHQPPAREDRVQASGSQGPVRADRRVPGAAQQDAVPSQRARSCRARSRHDDSASARRPRSCSSELAAEPPRRSPTRAARGEARAPGDPRRRRAVHGHVRVAAYAALLLALPLLLYQAYAFVLPAFSPRERQVALPLMLMVPFLFIAGVVFAYFMVLPHAIDFLQNFNDDNYDILAAGARTTTVRDPRPDRDGAAVPGAGRDPRAHARGDRLRRAAARSRALRASWSSRSSRCCCPGQDPVTMLSLMAAALVLFEGSILLAALLDRRAGAPPRATRPRWPPTTDDELYADHDDD